MADRPRKALILARGGRRLSRAQRQALERIEQALPEGAHLRIWSEIEIFDLDGTVRELDAVALGHYGLYVLEVKDISGRVEGDERARSIEVMRRQHVVNATLLLVRENARRLEDFLVQELGGEGILVEPLVLLSNDDLETALPEPTRRHVVTPSEMLRALVSGELPGDVARPSRVPVDAPTTQAIANFLGGLRRTIRPGHGNLQQELSVLQRDLVADLGDVMARRPEAITPSLGGRANELRLRIEEVAAAWVIACVFVRRLEELGLIERWLAGTGAEERERAFLAESSSRTPRDYLMHLLSVVGQDPACEPILGRGNRFLWNVPPSESGAAALLSFFRGGDDRTRERQKKELLGEGLWGELYERLSEPLRSANATVQTPAIVEDLLLDRTLDPAITELGASRVSVLDPACGSGTLLVGAFRRLTEMYPLPPGGDRAVAALDQVHGVDISPAATMITRIRLLLAYCEVTGCKHISKVPVLPLHVVTADSLLPLPGEPSDELLDVTPLSPRDDVFARRYSVIVCAPPLISTRDPALRDAYRERYRSAARNFPLYSPFIECCFQLADDGGFVGVLVGNSFMKREFGKPLVEDVLPGVDLTHIVDTSGAYIPGYGTPTMLLLGRNRPPASETIRVLVGKRGEPIAPIHPGEGRVWSSIVTHLNQPGYEDDYVAVSDVPREQLARHPWSLGTRDVMNLREALERGAVHLQDLAASVRRGARSGLDQVYMLPRRMAERLGIEPEVLRPLVHGAAIRDFSFPTEDVALVPPEYDLPRPLDQHPRWWVWLQRFRPILGNRRAFGSVALRPWWTWLQGPRASGTRIRIIGSMIANNNHFALARGDLVAAAAVLVIEPSDATSEAELYSWLGFLNSSTASFWMKQVAPVIGHVNGGVRAGEPRYEFSGAISRLPIPRAILEPGALRDDLVALARQLEGTAKDLAATAPEQVIGRWDRSSRESLVESLADAQLRERTLLRRMVCEQEDLDWLVYEATGLTKGERPIPKASASPEQRPFAWLTDEPPVGLDRRLVETWRRRRKAGHEHGPLKILEAASYKRTFRGIEDDRDVDLDEPREELELDSGLPALERRDSMDYVRRTKLACERWLLDRLEESFRDMPPRCASAQELTSRLRALAGVPVVVSVLVQERGDLSAATLEKHVVELVSGQAVPYLAALRHTESGLEKRAQWEAAWALQCRQYAGELVASIPVPPSYDRTDYRDASTVRHRGKLDVATERFIAYPGDGDAEPRYGWAGWTPAQQAEALVALVERCQGEGRAAAHVAPLLAGILELVAWIRSWEGAVPARGSAAETFQLRVHREANRLGLNIKALQAWRPSGLDRREQSKGNR
jgi:hypothetical protein